VLLDVDPGLAFQCRLCTGALRFTGVGGDHQDSRASAHLQMALRNHDLVARLKHEVGLFAA
jgi:hypothetical protein